MGDAATTDAPARDPVAPEAEGGRVATRLYSIVVDARDPMRLAGWWAGTLDWWPGHLTPEEATVLPPEGESGVPLVFGRVDDVPSTRNRIHIDLASRSEAEQRDTVASLLTAGASRADIGQGDVPWEVLADPEGNLFCVLEPRPVYARTGRVAAIVQPALDPDALARFWMAAADWDVVDSTDRTTSLRHPDGAGPYLELLRTDQPKTVKNRWHLDVAPWHDDDQDEEVARLVALGARPVDVGQSAAAPGEVTWVVLADPEGNEFCVLRPR